MEAPTCGHRGREEERTATAVGSGGLGSRLDKDDDPHRRQRFSSDSVARWKKPLGPQFKTGTNPKTNTVRAIASLTKKADDDDSLAYRCMQQW